MYILPDLFFKGLNAPLLQCRRGHLVVIKKFINFLHILAKYYFYLDVEINVLKLCFQVASVDNLCKHF